MWKPSESEIRNVVASEIESDSGSIEDLADRLIEQASRARERTPRDQWRNALHDLTTWSAYCAEVHYQVAARQAAAKDAEQRPVRASRQPAPPPPLIHARIVDGFDGGRLLAFLRGDTPEWCCNVQALTADLIVEAVARIFRKETDARIALDISNCQPPIWRVALLHVLPLHRQAGATAAQVVSFINELIGNGKALADLGLDGKGDQWPARQAVRATRDPEPDRGLAGDLVRSRRECAFLREQASESRREARYQRERCRSIMDDVIRQRQAAVAREAIGPAFKVYTPAPMRLATIDFLFEGAPGPEGPRFVEAVEGGKGVRAGDWIMPEPGGDGFTRLRVAVLLPIGPAEAEAAPPASGEVPGKEASATG